MEELRGSRFSASPLECGEAARERGMTRAVGIASAAKPRLARASVLEKYRAVGEAALVDEIELHTDVVG